jgi:hypothetical protein
MLAASMSAWVSFIVAACGIGSASRLLMAYIAGHYNQRKTLVGKAMNFWLRLQISARPIGAVR